MEYNKLTTNPMLLGAIEVVKAENTSEHQKMVSDQIVEGTYICPATVNPLPEIDEDGNVKMAPKTQIKFPVLAAPNGKHFFMAFTDKAEYEKWSGHENSQYFAATFVDYIGLLFRKDENGNPNTVEGMVINPYGANLIVPRAMVEKFAMEKMAEAKAAQAAAAAKKDVDYI